jgi:hypothetical protein
MQNDFTSKKGQSGIDAAIAKYLEEHRDEFKRHRRKEARKQRLAGTVKKVKTALQYLAFFFAVLCFFVGYYYSKQIINGEARFWHWENMSHYKEEGYTAGSIVFFSLTHFMFYAFLFLLPYYCCSLIRGLKKDPANIEFKKWVLSIAFGLLLMVFNVEIVHFFQAYNLEYPGYTLKLVLLLLISFLFIFFMLFDYNVFGRPK